MIVIPGNVPVVQGMNSPYLNVGRFIEHFSGDITTTGIHFVSSTAEGADFIDQHTILNGIFTDKTGTLKGAAEF